MSRRNRGRGRARKSKTPRLVAVIAALAVAVLLAALAVRLISGAWRFARSGGAGEADPQFAQPAETVTRPPELMGEYSQEELAEDPSLGWDLGEQTPVDKTAEELSREAAAGQHR